MSCQYKQFLNLGTFVFFDVQIKVLVLVSFMVAVSHGGVYFKNHL
jgi:hypothetical protein